VQAAIQFVMGVIKQADGFQSLGVTAFWLSPLFEQVVVIL
jgi:glycosidase